MTQQWELISVGEGWAIGGYAVKWGEMELDPSLQAENILLDKETESFIKIMINEYGRTPNLRTSHLFVINSLQH